MKIDSQLSFETQQALKVITAQWQSYEYVVDQLAERVPAGKGLRFTDQRNARRAKSRPRTTPLPPQEERQLSGQRQIARAVLRKLVSSGRVEEQEYVELTLNGPVVHAIRLSESARQRGEPADVVRAEELDDDGLAQLREEFRQELEKQARRFEAQLEAILPTLAAALTEHRATCMWAWGKPLTGSMIQRVCGAPASAWAISSPRTTPHAPLAVCEEHSLAAHNRGFYLQRFRPPPGH